MISQTIKNNPAFNISKAFLIMALSYLLLGLGFGLLGGLQYIETGLLKQHFSFQKTRPLHVYLVISFLFTSAQALIYYFICDYSGRKLYSEKAAWIHFTLQLVTSLSIVISFFAGKFGGREYLEFPPLIGILVLLSWIPFAFNFIKTLKPNFRNAPVYIWSWSTGILFFFITFLESYLWVFDYFSSNIIRDITIQWKALGSMVGSWNMMIYGSGMYIMEKISRDKKLCQSPLAFFFYFLGLTNLMFNWGHHTYIVPAAPWIKQVAFIISMTELLILGHIIWKWRKTLSDAVKNYYNLAYRFMSYADLWIFLNLFLAILISIPEINYYTHGTLITVAHAMGATIGINTMILLGVIYFILQNENISFSDKFKKYFGINLVMTNISLLIFWVAFLMAGLVKISGTLGNKTFYQIMNMLSPYFKVISISGLFLFLGLFFILFFVIRILFSKKIYKKEEERKPSFVI